MSTTKAIMADEQLPPALLRDMEHGDTRTMGEHDTKHSDPHEHLSILTIEGGRVIDVDWGYHTEIEAINAISKAE